MKKQALSVAAAPPVRPLSEEERSKMAESLRSLPKDKVVSAMRSAGLDKEADDMEHQLAEEYLAEQRREKLEELQSLPEEERLQRLIELGYTDEAKALSEQLADAKTDASEEKPVVKKKGGRPKKQKA